MRLGVVVHHTLTKFFYRIAGCFLLRELAKLNFRLVTFSRLFDERLVVRCQFAGLLFVRSLTARVL